MRLSHQGICTLAALLFRFILTSSSTAGQSDVSSLILPDSVGLNRCLYLHHQPRNWMDSKALCSSPFVTLSDPIKNVEDFNVFLAGIDSMRKQMFPNFLCFCQQLSKLIDVHLL
jgi:hypothetical protein